MKRYLLVLLELDVSHGLQLVDFNVTPIKDFDTRTEAYNYCVKHECYTHGLTDVIDLQKKVDLKRRYIGGKQTDLSYK